MNLRELVRRLEKIEDKAKQNKDKEQWNTKTT